MSPVVGNILTGVATIVGAALVIALVHVVLSVRDNTSELKILAASFKEHLDEKARYREGVERRLKALEKRAGRMPR